MNCIPGSAVSGRPAARAMRALVPGLSLLLSAFFAASCSAPVSEARAAPPAKPSSTYRIDYLLTPAPLAGGTEVTLRLEQRRRLLREFDMQARGIDPASVSGDGDVRIGDGRIVWKPPSDGGTLRWFAPLDHLRAEDGFDAHINSEWAIFRAEDAMPPVRTRTLKGAVSETYLSFDLPRGWSAVTQYFRRNDRFAIRNRERRFVRPTGWILLGNIGARNEDIAGTRVIVAGPVGQSVRRMDILALMQWTLPELVALLPEPPRRLTVISAGDPMWRGGLSAPSSMFVHAERPLLSENGTSTLLHELMHVGIGLDAEANADWIVEGLAEYYALELLRRSGTISPRRFAAALEHLGEWGAGVTELCQPNASGAVTARAVLVFHALDGDIRRESTHSLDDLVRRLVIEDKDLSVAKLQATARDLTGEIPNALAEDQLPGCAG